MTENKRFNVFDVDGTIFLEDHKEGSYHIGEIGNVDVNCLNDIADRLNELSDENEQLRKENDMFSCELSVSANKEISRNCRIAELEEENKQLKKELKSIEDSFKFSCTENHIEFNKDKLKVEDTHTELTLKDGKLCISVFIPQLNEYVKFFYLVTGRKMEREFINYEGDNMIEKLYGNIPSYGKSYFTEKFEEVYSSMVKKSLEATLDVVDVYIEFWSDDGVQEFYFDVSPLEVLEELKTTLITGEYPTKMVEE